MIADWICSRFVFACFLSIRNLRWSICLPRKPIFDWNLGHPVSPVMFSPSSAVRVSSSDWNFLVFWAAVLLNMFLYIYIEKCSFILFFPNKTFFNLGVFYNFLKACPVLLFTSGFTIILSRWKFYLFHIYFVSFFAHIVLFLFFPVFL